MKALLSIFLILCIVSATMTAIKLLLAVIGLVIMIFCMVAILAQVAG